MHLQDKKILFWLCVIVLIIITFYVLIFQKNSGYTYKKGVSPEYDMAVGVALGVFNRQTKGIDLSSGPCLTNDLIPGWVVDIVHNPREEIDNLPENQCQAYLEGRAKHFVEFDQTGNVIRVK